MSAGLFIAFDVLVFDYQGEFFTQVADQFDIDNVTNKITVAAQYKDTTGYKYNGKVVQKVTLVGGADADLWKPGGQVNFSLWRQGRETKEIQVEVDSPRNNVIKALRFRSQYINH